MTTPTTPTKAIWALLIAVTVATVGAGMAPAAGRTEAYTTFVACGYQRDKPASVKPTHFCPRGERVGAFFRRNFGQPNSLVHYKVCVNYDRGGTQCEGRQPARKLGRRLYLNPILDSGPGRHKVSWFVAGKRVGTWYFRRPR